MTKFQTDVEACQASIKHTNEELMKAQADLAEANQVIQQTGEANLQKQQQEQQQHQPDTAHPTEPVHTEPEKPAEHQPEQQAHTEQPVHTEQPHATQEPEHHEGEAAQQHHEEHIDGADQHHVETHHEEEPPMDPGIRGRRQRPVKEQHARKGKASEHDRRKRKRISMLEEHMGVDLEEEEMDYAAAAAEA